MDWFFKLCAKTDIEQSDAEEIYRYHESPPYYERLIKWMRKSGQQKFKDLEDNE